MSIAAIITLLGKVWDYNTKSEMTEVNDTGLETQALRQQDELMSKTATK